MNVFIRDLPFCPGTTLVRVPWGATVCAIFEALGAPQPGGLGPLIHLYHDGHRAEMQDVFRDNDVYLHARIHRALPGGKGGFGATLRGTASARASNNTDACRDLAGRRLRDVRKQDRKRARDAKLDDENGVNEEEKEKEEGTEKGGANKNEERVADVEQMMMEDEDVLVDDIAFGLTAKRRRVSDA